MALYTIKEETLTDIGDAIRAKLGTEETISPLDMPEAISSIETGGMDFDELVAQGVLTIDKTDEESGVIPFTNADQLGGIAAAEYALKTDTVANATMLGSKPPEYYLTPVNLLDNSDFRNPVNQNGKTSYTAAGYTIDRWYSSNANGVISVGDGYVSVASASGGGVYVLHWIPNGILELGKTYTLAICDADGAVSAKSGELIRGISIPAFYPIQNSTGAQAGFRMEYDSSRGCHSIILSTSKTIAYQIKWISLYEGSYTAETLPPYVPTHPRVENLKLGNPVHPVNLLDNSNFANPVNQRGQTSYTENGYTIDRWRTWSDNTITEIKDGYLYHTEAIYQYVEGMDINKVYTFAVKNTDGEIIICSGKPIDFPYNNGINIQSGGDGVFPYVRIWGENQVKNVEWAALYEGEYTAETLPPYVPKPYAVELAECQRYYRRLEHTGNMVLFPAIAYNTKSLYGTLPFGFRVKPTIHVSNVVFCKTGITGAKAVVSIASTGTILGGITPILLTVNDGDATTGDTYNIWTSTNGGYMELSADL